jgi:hypothetical protein
MRIYPNLTVDGEFKTLGDLGYTGALNDRQFTFLRAQGYQNSLADMMGSWKSYSPLILFSASEPGVWYDPSDITTLFQDTSGTTPVTATGQSVGLMLDKSKGLALGSELVTNGNFSAGSTGWTLGLGWSVTGGAASITVSLATNALTQGIGVAGKTYQITYTIVSVSAQGFRVFAGGSSGVLRTSAGTYTELIQCGSTNNLVGVAASAIGTTGTIDNISVKELPGNHATQSTGASRPTYMIDGTGRPYLSFDGVDDSMITSTITPGTDKVQVFAGVRKLSDAAQAIFCEFSATTNSNNGSFRLTFPISASSNYGWSSKGTVLSSPFTSGFAAPTTDVVTGIGDISGDVATIRVDGVERATTTTDQGTGNYLAYPLYIGRRGGTTLPFNGNFYSLIVRFGVNLTEARITPVESWVNGKTGAY